MFTRCIAERLRSLEPGKMQTRGSLAILPLFGASDPQPEYELLRSDADAKVLVRESSAHGSVPELVVENRSGRRVLILAGEHLLGAKQNRVVNTDLLIPARSKRKIPVTCVEQGRWHSTSESMRAGPMTPPSIRALNAEAVSRNAYARRCFDSDQGAVWGAVGKVLCGMAIRSPSSALSDAYRERAEELDEVREEMHVPAGAVGVAVFYGSDLIAVDIFDKAATLGRFWDRLMDGYSMDWLARRAAERAKRRVRGEPGGKEKEDAALEPLDAIEEVGEALEHTQWAAYPSPGEGYDCRMSARRHTATALVWEERIVVHAQVFPLAKRRRREEEFAVV